MKYLSGIAAVGVAGEDDGHQNYQNLFKESVGGGGNDELLLNRRMQSLRDLASFCFHGAQWIVASDSTRHLKFERD